MGRLMNEARRRSAGTTAVTRLLGPLLATVVVAAGCGETGSAAGGTAREDRAARAAAAGRLTPRLRSVPPDGPVLRPGVHEVRVGRGRPGLVFVPRDAARERRVPLVVTLHGAGGNARSGLALLREVADEAGVALLAPSSRGRTWDVVLGGYGRDVAMLDALLRRVSTRLAVDPARVGIAGFSDGASYALSLGLTNGDLFSGVVAFSPGFSAETRRRGRPVIFQSHGVEDEVLPIDRTSRRLVPRLREAGYRVTYREFGGGHIVPPDIARDALDRVLSPLG